MTVYVLFLLINYINRKKSQDQNDLKAKILKMRENLKEITITAPVNEAAKKKLLNVDDNEIIKSKLLL